jgi:ubiquinone biosynthesis protein
MLRSLTIIILFPVVLFSYVLRSRFFPTKRLWALAPLICSNLGGAFPKLGQILSTRADLLPSQLCASLSTLQDNVRAMPPRVVERQFRSYSVGLKLTNIEINPTAAATVAQVHRAERVDNGKVVAVKLIRPGIRGEIDKDCRLAQILSRFLAHFDSMKSIPIQEALRDVSLVLIRQTDLRQEARNHARLQRMFADDDRVIVPALHEDLCCDHLLVTDFIPGMKKLTDPTLPETLAQQALVTGVQALYQMIFKEGFIHCDMHPGNVLVAQDGRLVILDAGFMTEVNSVTRQAFAEFFLSIAMCDGPSAARIVLETAQRVPAGLRIEIFENDICALIDHVGGLTAKEFNVAGFVGELFAIQRKHNVYGTNQFTLSILSLLVFEGVVKQRFPGLDFQQEAIPFVQHGFKSL